MHNFQISVEVLQPVLLHAAALAEYIADHNRIDTAREDGLRLLGPAHAPDINACLVLLLDPVSLPGCRIHDRGADQVTIPGDSAFPPAKELAPGVHPAAPDLSCLDAQTGAHVLRPRFVVDGGNAYWLNPIGDQLMSAPLNSSGSAVIWDDASEVQDQSEFDAAAVIAALRS